MAIYTADGTKVADSSTDIVLPNPDEIQQLKRMADTAQEQADIAKKQAEEAKKTARWANIKSWAAGIISVISLAGMLLANARPIVETVMKLLSLLGFPI